MERPVLVSNVGGLLELITPGETGLSFNAGDEQDIARQAIRLFASEPWRVSLGQAARRYVAEHRNWSDLVHGYHEVYRLAIAHHDARKAHASNQPSHRAGQ